MAGAAIGVSHVVQSTRAGAQFGLSLLWLVVVVNLLKYPFFEYGHRYTAATGETLLQGYRKLGPGYLWTFLVLNFIAAVISIAGVTLVTAVLLPDVLGGGLNLEVKAAVLLLFCVGLVALGQYRWLDGTIKTMMTVLFLATVVACAAAVFGVVGAAPEVADAQAGSAVPFVSPWTLASLPFLIALMGWMPAPIELSVWHSLWFKANQEARQRKTSAAEARLDFHLGYGLCLLLAVLFLILGALVMHGSGESFAASNAAFTRQFIELYTSKLGSWSAPVIIAAAFITMFSTTLTVVDAYPRSLAEGLRTATGKTSGWARTVHLFFMVLCCAFGWWIIFQFVGRQQVFHALVDTVTIIAFLTAPFFGWLNYRLIVSRHTPTVAQPGPWMRGWSLFGLTFLIGFGLVYLYVRFLA